MSDPRDAASDAAGEPSMEDILASIRRILSEGGEEAEPTSEGADGLAFETDDGDGPAEAAQARADAPEDEDGLAADPFATLGDETADDDGDDRAADRHGDHWDDGAAALGAAAAAGIGAGAAAAAGRASNVFELTPAMKVPGTGIISPPTADASTDVLTQLARAILDRRDIALGARDVTLEGMVREMLRPLLKEWLDRNLPYLIERLVKREIDVMINRAERLED